MRGGLICYFRKNPEVKHGWDPEDHVKDQRAEKLRQHHLPIVHGDSSKRLDGAKFKFFGEQAHRDERKNQDEREPEEDRIKKCFLNRVLYLAPIHEGDLKIEINPANDEKEDQHNVGDRRVKIATNFAREQGVKLSHKLSITSTDKSMTPARNWMLGVGRWAFAVPCLHLVWMRQLNEHVLERRSTLS